MCAISVTVPLAAFYKIIKVDEAERHPGVIVLETTEKKLSVSYFTI